MGIDHTYSSYGGLVAGSGNIISGPFASVSGGRGNSASGPSASVSGGFLNGASGQEASVSGGAFNSASGASASVSGGRQNIASGVAASVSGGISNTASEGSASVSGGTAILPADLRRRSAAELTTLLPVAIRMCRRSKRPAAAPCGGRFPNCDPAIELRLSATARLWRRRSNELHAANLMPPLKSRNTRNSGLRKVFNGLGDAKDVRSPIAPSSNPGVRLVCASIEEGPAASTQSPSPPTPSRRGNPLMPIEWKPAFKVGLHRKRARTDEPRSIGVLRGQKKLDAPAIHVVVHAHPRFVQRDQVSPVAYASGSSSGSCDHPPRVACCRTMAWMAASTAV